MPLHLTGLHTHQERWYYQAPRLSKGGRFKKKKKGGRAPEAWDLPCCSQPSLSSHGTHALLEILRPHVPPGLSCHQPLQNTSLESSHLPVWPSLHTLGRVLGSIESCHHAWTQEQQEGWGGCPGAWQVREAGGNQWAWKSAGHGTPCPRGATPDSGCRLKPGHLLLLSFF